MIDTGILIKTDLFGWLSCTSGLLVRQRPNFKDGLRSKVNCSKQRPTLTRWGLRAFHWSVFFKIQLIVSISCIDEMNCRQSGVKSLSGLVIAEFKDANLSQPVIKWINSSIPAARWWRHETNFTNILLTLFQAGINNYTQCEVWDDVTHLFPNLTGTIVEVGNG